MRSINSVPSAHPTTTIIPAGCASALKIEQCMEQLKGTVQADVMSGHDEDDTAAGGLVIGARANINADVSQRMPAAATQRAGMHMRDMKAACDDAGMSLFKAVEDVLNNTARDKACCAKGSDRLKTSRQHRLNFTPRIR